MKTDMNIGDILETYNNSISDEYRRSTGTTALLTRDPRTTKLDPWSNPHRPPAKLVVSSLAIAIYGPIK